MPVDRETSRPGDSRSSVGQSCGGAGAIRRLDGPPFLGRSLSVGEPPAEEPSAWQSPADGRFAPAFVRHSARPRRGRCRASVYVDRRHLLAGWAPARRASAGRRARPRGPIPIRIQRPPLCRRGRGRVGPEPEDFDDVATRADEELTEARPASASSALRDPAGHPRGAGGWRRVVPSEDRRAVEESGLVPAGLHRPAVRPAAPIRCGFALEPLASGPENLDADYLLWSIHPSHIVSSSSAFVGLLALGIPHPGSAQQQAAQPAVATVPAPPDVAAVPADAQKSASGLAWKVLTPGTGTVKPGPFDKVTVNYSGWTTDGTLFDSTIERGKPSSFQLSNVLQGLGRRGGDDGGRREAPPVGAAGACVQRRRRPAGRNGGLRHRTAVDRGSASAATHAARCRRASARCAEDLVRTGLEGAQGRHRYRTSEA